MRYEINTKGQVSEYPDDPPTPLTPEQIIAQYDQAMLALFDEVAKRKKYDNRITCALRAGYDGPFRSEGEAFGAWMDACNAYGYQELDKVLNGLRTAPTIAEFLSELPPTPW